MHIFFQDEVQLTAPKSINLEECILCQRKKRSEYLSSGEIGRGCIASLAKRTESQDARVTRVLQLTVSEQSNMKYHASSCYRRFQLDMGKLVSLAQPSVDPPDPLQQSQEPTYEQCEQSEPSVSSEQRSKRFKPSETKNVCIFCGADRKTVKQKKFAHCIESVKSQWHKNY